MLPLRKYRIMRKILDLFAFKDFGKTTTTEKQCTIQNVVRSGDYCKCGACGYEGYAYGIAHAKGVSAPFCQNCGVNSKLSVIEK